jgi:hypothetical protein
LRLESSELASYAESVAAMGLCRDHRPLTSEVQFCSSDHGDRTLHLFSKGTFSLANDIDEERVIRPNTCQRFLFLIVFRLAFTSFFARVTGTRVSIGKLTMAFVVG